MPPALDNLRRHAVARSLFTPTTLPKAIDRLGFVQADPIRAPARAQDLTLRHRVAGYRAGRIGFSNALFRAGCTPNTAPDALESVFGFSCDLPSFDSAAERRPSQVHSVGYP